MHRKNQSPAHKMPGSHLPYNFLAIPAVGRCRLPHTHFKTIFLQPEGCTKASSTTMIQASPWHDSASIRCGHNCWNGAWLWNLTIQIYFLPFRMTIISSLLEILLTKLQGFACKPQKSLYLHFFIKQFHFVTVWSVQLPSENRAKVKWNSFSKYLFLIY